MHRIGFLLCDGFQIMTLATQSVFEYANVAAGEPFYAIENYSADGGEVRSSLGMTVGTRALRGRVCVDTWIVTGVNNPLDGSTPDAVITFLRKASRQARRIVAICTGGFVLAQAGLLAQKRATTHWFYAREL